MPAADEATEGDTKDQELLLAAQFGQMLLAEQEKLKSALADARDTESTLRNQLQEAESESLSLRSRNTALQGKLAQLRNESLSTQSPTQQRPRSFRFENDALARDPSEDDGGDDGDGGNGDVGGGDEGAGGYSTTGGSAVAELERRRLEALVQELTKRNEKLEGLLEESSLEQAAQVRLRHELVQSMSARQRSSVELDAQRTRRRSSSSSGGHAPLAATLRAMSMGPGVSATADGGRRRAGSVGMPVLAETQQQQAPAAASAVHLERGMSGEEDFQEQLTAELHAQLAQTAEDLHNTEELFEQQGAALRAREQELAEARAAAAEQAEHLEEQEAALAEQRELADSLRHSLEELRMDNDELRRQLESAPSPSPPPAVDADGGGGGGGSTGPPRVASLGEQLGDALASGELAAVRRQRDEARAQADEMAHAFAEVNDALSRKAEEVYDLRQRLAAAEAAAEEDEYPTSCLERYLMTRMGFSFG